MKLGSKTPAILLLVFSLTVLAYFNSMHGQLQFDDFHQIVDNDATKHLSNIPKFFVSSKLTSQHQWGTGYRPVTSSSYALNYYLSEDDPWSYHAFNLLLHLINSLLVYLLIRRILNYCTENVSRLETLSGAATLIFALHPIQTNAVTYISGRSLLLATAFGLFSFYSFLRYRESESGTPWAAATLFSFVLALLSKEVAVCFPIFMFLYIILVPQRGKPARSSFKLFALLALALAIYLTARKVLIDYITAPSATFSRLEYMLSETKAVILYLKLMLLPINQNADYNLPVTKSLDAGAAISILLVAGLAVTFLLIKRKMPVIAFFGFWLLTALAPEALIVPLADIAVEYRMYIPSIGFIAAAVILADRFIKSRSALGALLMAAAILLGILTFERNKVWATERSFWSDIVKKSPGSARAHSNYGTALFEDGLYEEAIMELTRAFLLDPLNKGQAYTLNSLGLCYMKLKMDAEAEIQFRQAINLEPEIEEPYLNLGFLYRRHKRYDDEVEILKMLLYNIPGSVTGRRNLAAAEAVIAGNTGNTSIINE